MRKKILAAVLAATMPEVMHVNKKKIAEKAKDEKIDEEKIDEVTVSENIAENVVEEPVIEEITAENTIDEEMMVDDTDKQEIVPEEIVSEEIALEETVPEQIALEEIVPEKIEIEENSKKIEIKEIIPEVQSKFKYEFEGKYWIRYSEYGHIGWYFEDLKATGGMEGKGIFYRDYFVDGDLINISGKWYKYEIVNGKLGLALARDVFSRSSYYEEISKGEFESLFA